MFYARPIMENVTFEQQFSLFFLPPAWHICCSAYVRIITGNICCGSSAATMVSYFVLMPERAWHRTAPRNPLASLIIPCEHVNAFHVTRPSFATACRQPQKFLQTIFQSSQLKSRVPPSALLWATFSRRLFFPILFFFRSCVYTHIRGTCRWRRTEAHRAWRRSRDRCIRNGRVRTACTRFFVV